MKKFLLLFALFFCFSLSASAPFFIMKDQIILTDEGMFCDISGSLYHVNSLNYQNGYYTINIPVFGRECEGCGSTIGPDGKCSNPYCNRSGKNGPKEKD